MSREDAPDLPAAGSPAACQITLAEFQQLIRDMYLRKDVARGVEGTFMWLMEEIGELAGAVREGTPQQKATEFADVLAWLVTLANVEGVELGKCEIGFSNSSSAVDGLFGRPPFKKKMETVKQLANLYAQYFQMVVVDSSPIKSPADFKGKIIATTPKGHTGTILTEQVLEVYGLSFKDLSKIHFVGYSDAVALMKDGHADIYSPGTTIPASSIIDLAADRKIRLIPLPDDKIKALQKINAGYLKRVTPKGTYPGVDYDVPGVGYFAHLVVSSKLPDDLVYKITKTLATNLPRFADVVKDMKGVTPKDLALDIGIPFHPGALKYYKEAKVL